MKSTSNETTFGTALSGPEPLVDIVFARLHIIIWWDWSCFDTYLLGPHFFAGINEAQCQQCSLRLSALSHRSVLVKSISFAQFCQCHFTFSSWNGASASGASFKPGLAMCFSQPARLLPLMCQNTLAIGQICTFHLRFIPRKNKIQ